MVTMFRRLGLINKNQRGLTLLELVLAFTISAVITGALTITLHQLITSNLRSGNHMTAIKQVQDAGYWISHDAFMSQSVTTGDDPAGTGFPLTLTWSYWGDYGSEEEEPVEEHEAVYTLEDISGSSLKNLLRTHTVTVDGTETTDTGIIAQFIDPDPEKTNCYMYKCLICDEVFTSLDELEAHFESEHPTVALEGNSESGKLILKVTATVGVDSGEQSETRIYEIVPRAMPE